GFGKKSVENLLRGIDARRRIGLDRFVFALGVRHIGETTARDLAKAYGTWEALRTAIDGAAAVRPGRSYRRMIAVKGLGPKTADTLMQALGSGSARGGDLFDRGPRSFAEAAAGIKGVRASAAEALEQAFSSVEEFLETARRGGGEMPGDAYRELAS